MSYIDKDILLDNLVSKNVATLHDAIKKIDKRKLEQDILKEHGDIFQPFLCTYKAKEPPGEKMASDDHELLCALYEWVQGSKMEARRALKKLIKLKEKYPKVPTIYNFISAAYQTLGKDKKRYHTIKMTCEKFPDYLFAKITLAEDSLNKGCHEEVPDIFDQKLQLYMHYPDAGNMPTFHGSEVQAFYTVVGRYYARSQQVACAIKCYFLVEKANENSPHLDVLVQEIVTAEVAGLILSSLKASTSA